MAKFSFWAYGILAIATLSLVLASTLISAVLIPANPYKILEYTQPQAELYVGTSANPNVYDPVNITSGYEPCDNFTVYVKARNISDLLYMDFYMNFNPNCLEVLNDTPGVPNVFCGACWGIVPPGIVGTVNNTKGSIEGYGAARIVGTLSGNLTLFGVKFHMKDWGESLLQITDTPTVMLDSNEDPILCPVTDGLFNIPEVHDVAIVEVKTFSPVHGNPGGRPRPPLRPVTQCYETWTIYINVTVINEGDFAESFNVTAYYNETAIRMQTVTDLPPGANTTLTFTWKPPPLPPRPFIRLPDDPSWVSWVSRVWPYPIYYISAEASVVEGENDTNDNFMVDGSVKVKWIGDATGDGRVNIYDLCKLALSWMKPKTHIGYNPQCDFTGDGNIDVNDLAKIALRWAKGPLDPIIR